MKAILLASAVLLAAIGFVGTADAADPSPSNPISINCATPDSVMKAFCDIWCPIATSQIMAGPVDWLITCATT